MRRRHQALSRTERFDLGRTAFWALLVLPAYWFGWLRLVAFVSILSLWALVEAAWGAYRGGDEKLLREVDRKLDQLLEILKDEGRPEERPASVEPKDSERYHGLHCQGDQSEPEATK